MRYDHLNDLKKKNNRGSDEYYDETSTPPFAHSFLLTGVISQDYVDLSGDGMSPDDLGSYTKFNYTLSEKNFGWRNPIQKDHASYNEGLKSLAVGKESDDKGSIIYGEKELWYMHTIETKTHIAEFHTSNRLDAYGIKDINGGLDETSPMKKLDKIVLYTREEKAKETRELDYVAIPIKTVHFEYDYTLCPGYPNNLRSGQNNAGGKLTLRKVYFTYGNSNKGVLNDYEFTYGENKGALNPSYNLKAYDRWGNYSPNFTASCDNGNIPTKPEFPYVIQNKIEEDQYAVAWHMTEIKLPSGGKIQVDYESDDYAYVQDRKAMQMFFVDGVINNPTDQTVDNVLYNGESGNNYLVFKLQDPVASLNQAVIKDFYLKDIQQLSFRFFMNLGSNAQEYVPGYAEIDRSAYGVYQHKTNGNGEYTHGYVKLKGVGIKHSDDNGGMNPISKAGWQFMRLNLPRKAYGQNSPNEDSFVQILKAMGSTFSQIEQYINGFNKDLRGKGYSKTFVPGKSWVRFHNPNGHKLGGGSRVKKVVISDQWEEMGGGYTRTYGQEYNYETTEDINGITRTISSGVASYEPIAGGDENPFRRPIFTSQKAYLAPGIDSYQEEPFGEDFMPSPSVVYSKVTVKNIQNDEVKRNATGRVVHEFYTAKDFPTKINRTSPNVARSGNKDNVSNILKISVQDYATVSQGFSIVLNDMHGKQKAQRVYPEASNDPISWVEYHYAVDKDEIENTHKVMYKYNSDGLIQDAEIGLEMDVAVDMRESRNKTTSGGASFNTDGFLAAIFPFVLPTIFPNYAQEETQFRSATVTKVINKAGILKETVAFDLGSQVSTTNELYDAKTGEVLLTKTVNQFDDEVYNFTYPAHWAYDEMGSSYENVGFREKNKTLSSLNSKYFNEGDELLLRKGNITKRVWVTSTMGGLSVKDINGSSSYSEEYNDILLIRSGKRNMQATPIGTVTTLTNPIKTINGKASLSFDQVINAQATEFTDEWSVFCNCGVDPNGDGYNPYKEGARGIWRPNRAFVYLTEREQTNLNGNLNIRQDGVFKTFKPFWQPPTRAGMSWFADETNWQYTTDITEFSTYGFELENQDALGRFSASIYGYSNTLPMGVANNSEYREIAFDSFEDYRTTDNCCGRPF